MWLLQNLKLYASSFYKTVLQMTGWILRVAPWLSQDFLPTSGHSEWPRVLRTRQALCHCTGCPCCVYAVEVTTTGSHWGKRYPPPGRPERYLHPGSARSPLPASRALHRGAASQSRVAAPRPQPLHPFPGRQQKRGRALMLPLGKLEIWRKVKK